MRFSSMGNSRKVLGAVLAAGVALGTLGIAAPAAAQKKGKEAAAVPAGPKVSVSKAFMPTAAAAQTAVNAAKADPAQVPAARAAVDAALAAAATATADDKFVAGQFAVALGSAVKDTALQRRGLQAMVDSGKTPADNPKYNFFLSSLAYDAKDYAAARAAAQAAIQGGYNDDQVYVILAETYIAENQPALGLAEFKRAVDAKRAAGQPVPEAWIRRAVTVAHKAKLSNEAAEWALTQVELYPNNFNWLASTQLVRLVGNYGPNETIDLFRLMLRSGAFDNDPKLLGNEYKEFIEAADPRRLPGEVVMVIDKGRTSGALPASQWTTDMRALASGRIAADKASLAAAARDAASSSSGLSALSTGDAYLNYGEPAKAEELYKLALSKGGIDKDRVLTRLGIAQFDQGKLAEARANFKQVGGARAPIGRLWLAFINSKDPAGAKTA